MAYTFSKRKKILDQIINLLSNITVANGFPVEIKTISTEILSLEDIHSEDSPAISLSISSGGSSSFITTGSNVDSIININLDFYIYTQPGENPVDELDKLVWSAEHALLNGTVNAPWNDKYLTASLNGLTYVYYVSFDEMFNTDEGLIALDKKAWARWPLTIKYIRSTIDP